MPNTYALIDNLRNAEMALEEADRDAKDAEDALKAARSEVRAHRRALIEALIEQEKTDAR